MIRNLNTKKMKSEGKKAQKRMEKLFKQRTAKKAKQAKDKAENTTEKISLN